METGVSEKFGLSIRNRKTIRDIFKSEATVNRVLIYGSRADDNYHFGSDIDLAITDGEVSFSDLLRIREKFEESDLPYITDIISIQDLKDGELRDNILRSGKVIYERD